MLLNLTRTTIRYTSDSFKGLALKCQAIQIPPETSLKTLRTLMLTKEILRSICSDDDLESWSDWIADIDSTVLRIGKSASENNVQQHFIENRVILLLANQIRSKIGMIRVDIRNGTRPPYCVRTKPSQK